LIRNSSTLPQSSAYIMKNDPHILIIEDHAIVIAAVEMVLKANFPSAVIQNASTFPLGLKVLGAGKPIDLIILDMEIPGGESYKMIEILRAVQPDVKILIFTGHEEARHALRFLKAGANGFLSKNAPLEDCGTAVKTVLSDKKYVSEQVQQLITNSLFDKSPVNSSHESISLTPRESEVLELLLQGKWIKEIATKLNLNQTTVSTHKARIFQKLEVSNVIELFKKLNTSAPEHPPNRAGNGS
jgi:two-component system invasion response regulator UvrY